MPAFEAVDDFFDGDDGAPRGEHRFLLNADDALDEDVALAIGLLRVDDGDVRPERRHRDERLSGERTGHRPVARVHLGEAAWMRPERRERQVRRAGIVGVGHRAVTELLQRQRTRPAVFHGVPQAVQRSDAWIPAPREHEPRRATGAYRADRR